MAVYDANQLWDEEEDVVESLEYVTPRVGTSYCEEGPRKGLAGSTRRPSRERIDMEDLTTCEIQRWFFARIFNSMLYFSKCTFTEQNSIHRSLKWQAKLTESRLKKLQANGYKDFHVSITSAVSYILRALEDIRYIRDDELIFQLVPNTCLIDKTLRARLKVNSMEVRQVNNAQSLSINLSVDVKFLFAGQFRTKAIPDQGERYYVAPTPCMGNYLDVAVTQLYDTVYDRTKEYIDEFFKRYPKDPVSTPVGVFGDESEAGTSKTDRATLKYLLRTVGRENNLKKLDLDKINVFALTSPVRSKNLKYLNAKEDLTFTIDTTPKNEAEAVFLSSFTRARIMDDGSLYFQIYSRACMYMSDNTEFPVTLHQ
ncbi:hypothetical protein J6590_055926 [Homalodisca vitripennis]|nr:hypothetical protein J6590_055926 [Homalodisca vitripennis]